MLWGYVIYSFMGDGLFLLLYFDAKFKCFLIFVFYLVPIAHLVSNHKLFMFGLSWPQYRLIVLKMLLFTVLYSQL